MFFDRQSNFRKQGPKLLVAAKFWLTSFLRTTGQGPLILIRTSGWTTSNIDQTFRQHEVDDGTTHPVFVSCPFIER
jgi:hypothetical protein